MSDQMITGRCQRHLSLPSDAAPPKAGAGAGASERSYSSAALARGGVLLAAGVMPVLSISLYVFGVLLISSAARYVVLPLAVVAMALAAHRSPESRWAVRGFVAGLVAVTAYDTLRMPMVFADVWPDFIPQLGGWVLGDAAGTSAPVGYAWRYIGDGGGIGLAFFVVCGMVRLWRYPPLAGRPVMLGVGYGVFVWSGLVGTVGLAAHGTEMLFPLTWASLGLSLAGHLVYGAVLGLFLRQVLARRSRSGLNRRTAVTDRAMLPASGAVEAAGIPGVDGGGRSQPAPQR